MSSTPPQPVVVRAEGTTPAERFLHCLCEQSFLALWSYPGLFRDQKVHGTGDGKELCDLLVVFAQDVLIFSDKSCAFPDTGNPELDWSRWFRKAIIDAAKQGWGAERWLRQFPERIFIDRGCTQRFPLELPPAHLMRVHQIVVAHNVTKRCAEYFGGGSSGSLVFNSDIRGRDHYDPKTCLPFRVGWLDEGKGFVHVLDDTSLSILLNTRDTITDFLDYLRSKEELLYSFKERGVRFSYDGEEELLANYLQTMKGDRHGFLLPEGYDAVWLQEGDWVRFQASPQRAAQLAADQISYAWDGLIEKFNANILGGTSHYTTNPRIADREKLLRFFAREPRVRRRLLADALIGLIEEAGPMQRATRIVLPSWPGDPHYCFLLLPRLATQGYEKYREVRRELLMMLCSITKLICPGALDIVGLATETGIDTEQRTEDALNLDARYWTEEMQHQAMAAQKRTGFLTKLTKFEDTISEFPISPPGE
jgi:hypothetical protein